MCKKVLWCTSPVLSTHSKHLYPKSQKEATQAHCQLVHELATQRAYITI